MSIANILAGLFSPGQITSIVLVSVLLAALIGLNVYLIFLLHKRGVHKMQTKQLQQQRDALLDKLNDMRAGRPFEFTSSPVRVKVITDASEEEDEEEEDVAADEDSEEFTEDEIEETLIEEEDEGGDAEIVVSETGAVVRYNRSFTARIVQSDNDLKARYSELKNYLLAFKGVKSHVSWKHEMFFIGRKSVARFVVRGKTLCLCLATDPALFRDTKYKVDDLSGLKKNKLPCMYRIKSDRRTGYAKELIDVVMAGFNTPRNESYAASDFTLPYKSTEVLIKQRLIKIIGGGDIPEFDKEDALAAARGIRYNRSFAARIVQSDDALKARYSALKNYLLAHENIRCVNSWKRETFRVGRNCVAAVIIRGKTLCLCLDADPKQYEGTKFRVEDYSLRSKRTNTPLLYRVRNDHRLGYAYQLIDKVFAEKEIGKEEREPINYVVPFAATETLIRRGLIKETKVAVRPSIFGEPPAEEKKEVAAAQESASEQSEGDAKTE